MSASPEKVEKIMSLDLAEFHRGLGSLAPGLKLGRGQKEASLPFAAQSVRVSYEPLHEATLGGLLKIPRARVTLVLGRLDSAERDAFLASFDKAFQRGGG